MIRTKKQDIPWWEKYRQPEKYTDSKDFVKGYNQALADFDILFGTARLPGMKFREAGLCGGNQVHKVCEEWKLEFQEKKRK